MKYVKFKQKILECEKLARNAPDRYRRKILFTVLSGYFYIAFLALLGLAGIILMAMSIYFSERINGLQIKLLLVLGVFDFLVISAIFVRVHPPRGIELGRDKYPGLFSLIDEIIAKTNSPKVAKVFLDDQFNASVCQVPRLGVLGWTKHYLVLGYPLMASLSPEHFKAVVAHEFGHVSKNHSAFSLWIYRVNMTWFFLAGSCNEGPLKLLIHPFAKWYVPLLNAVTFPSGRQHEYEADFFAGETVGKDIVAEALLALEVQACNFNENLVKPFWDQSLNIEKPPESSFHKMICGKMKEPLSPEKSAEFLARGLKRKTSVTDTHPSVEDRISALGEKPRTPAPFAVSAAEKYFGEELGNIAATLDREWLANSEPQWKQAYQNALEANKRIQEAEKKEFHNLTFEQKMDYAIAVEFAKGADAAREIFRKLMEDYPDSPIVHFSLGRILLVKNSEDGLAYMKNAIEKDVTLTNPAVSFVSAYLVENGRPDELDSWYGLEEDSESKILKAHKELGIFNVRHNYLPHNIEAEILEKIRNVLIKNGKIKQAYLVKKEVIGAGASVPVFLLAITTRSFCLSDADITFKIANQLGFFPYKIFVMKLGLSQLSFRKKLSRVDGSTMF